MQNKDYGGSGSLMQNMFSENIEIMFENNLPTKALTRGLCWVKYFIKEFKMQIKILDEKSILNAYTNINT